MNRQIITTKTKAIKKKRLCTVGILLVLAVVSFFVCICAGSSGMGFGDVAKTLFGNGSDSQKLVLFNIRLPRVLAAIIAGGGLSVSGCIMQKVLGNPMASPSTLGVSNGAVFGANVAIILFGAGSFGSAINAKLTVSNPYIITLCAFLGAAVGIAIILLLSIKSGFSSETVVLCGVAVGAFFSAGTTLIQYFSADTQVSSAVFWSFGDLGRASYKECVYMGIITAVGILFSAFASRDLDIMSGGDETAKTLGINTAVLRVTSLFLASLICAICVAFLGIIGFVGLIAPHIAKRLVGERMCFLMPSSALCGMTLLLLSDSLARSVIPGVSLPVGAVTSFFGGPVFLFLILRERRGRIANA